MSDCEHTGSCDEQPYCENGNTRKLFALETERDRMKTELEAGHKISIKNIECKSDCFGILPDGEECHFHRKETCIQGAQALKLIHYLGDGEVRNPNIYIAIDLATRVLQGERISLP